MKKNIYSVGQVNTYIKNMFAQDFMLPYISIRGEVSNCKYHDSGHIYFTLKDKTGVIQAVMFAGNRKGLSFPMQVGDDVVVTGSVEVYERDGKYQLYAKEIVLDGTGNLYQRYEAIKRELEEMGMFAEEYKQPIPKYARTIGVVTAPTGAAIQDIRNISARRNPYVQLILYPALVQGEGAVPSIINGIRALDSYGVDVIIVGRGGGSMEDLWAFNEEEVARAIFECRTPVISAVGHETDTTIADYVADLRAPTPSAAAELAVFDHYAAKEQMRIWQNRLDTRMNAKKNETQMRIANYKARLKLVSPAAKLRENRNYAVDLEEKLKGRMEQQILMRRHKLALLAGQLDGLSPAKKLSQGYSYVADQDGVALTDAAQTAVGEKLSIHLLHGTLQAEVTEVRCEEGNNGKDSNIRR